MSHLRRVQGRFQTTTATEAYQRQLIAPVHKWRKAWVAPTGQQPESSYKVCKWVKVDEQPGDVDEITPAPDGDEDVDEGAEEMEDEEEDVPGEGPTAPATPDVPPDLPAAPQPIDSLQPIELPSNAIELSNTAPTHAEAGQGDLGSSGPGMEVRLPELGEEISMDVEATAVPEEKDEGLVMGEMEPPEVEMGVVGGDEGPPELEG